MPDTDLPGPILVIGGHESKTGERPILRAFAEAVGGKDVVLVTVASKQTKPYVERYDEAFADLGIRRLLPLQLRDRAAAYEPEKLAAFEQAGGVFFTGGDQLRISSQIGDTPVEHEIRRLWEAGGIIAGTSAGAAVMPETMLVRGPGTTSYRLGDLHLAPGLGLLRDVIVDQHFAERGRMGRLIGAVAHNPRVLGIGLDEDTAIRVRGDRFEVLGAGAVYLIDGHGVSQSNIAEAARDETLSIFGIRLHVLAAGDSYDLTTRIPTGHAGPSQPLTPTSKEKRP